MYSVFCVSTPAVNTERREGWRKRRNGEKGDTEAKERRK